MQGKYFPLKYRQVVFMCNICALIHSAMKKKTLKLVIGTVSAFCYVVVLTNAVLIVSVFSHRTSWITISHAKPSLIVWKTELVNKTFFSGR